MQLDEFIKTMPADEMLFIGSKSSYFFIGTAEEYEKYIDQLSKDFNTIFIQRLARARHEGLRILSKFGWQKKYGKEIIENDDQLREIAAEAKALYLAMQDFVADCNSKKTAPLLMAQNGVKISLHQPMYLYNACVYLPRARANAANYKPMREREVTETYRRPCKGDGTVIVVTGDEDGPFWDRDDFDELLDTETGRVNVFKQYSVIMSKRFDDEMSTEEE